MAKRITKNQEEDIIKLYQEGKSTSEVAELIGVGATSVRRILKKYDIQIRSKGTHKTVNKFSSELESNMIKLYLDGKNTNEIAKIFGTYNTSVRRVLLRNNIELRSSSEAHRVVNLEDIKSKENTPEFDYFIGLIATDGCITDNRVVLDFSEENKELLDYWNEFLGNKCNITSYVHKKFNVPQYRISFRNEEICDYLKTFGIISNKTFDLTLSYINWDVLRGIIDGDGCIATTNHGSTLKIIITSGCKKFLEQIQEFYKANNIISYLNESFRNKNVTYDLYVYNTEDVLKIYNNLYSNAKYFLKRKKLKFGPLLQKCNKENFVNSGKENATPIPSQASDKSEEGVETLHEVPKS